MIVWSMKYGIKLVLASVHVTYNSYIKVTGCLSVFTKGSRKLLDRYGFPLQQGFSWVLERFITILVEDRNNLQQSFPETITPPKEFLFFFKMNVGETSYDPHPQPQVPLQSFRGVNASKNSSLFFACFY